MVLYDNLGYDSIDSYFKDFNDTLLITNHNFDYFVNWDKVYSNLKENLTEISILNSLNKVLPEELEDHFRMILNCYPEVVPILPSILAIRFQKNNQNIIEVFDGEFQEYDFNDETYDVEKILYFCKKTGLMDLFNRISDLYDYLLGTEVGLDSNGRKNRSGIAFESIIETLLLHEFKDQDNIEITIQDFVQKIDRSKRADFVISENGCQKIIIECNFYNSTGSKPIEVANSYVDLQQQLHENDMIFIWVTDGQGWKKMSKTLKEVENKIDYILNYDLLKRNIKNIIDNDFN